VRGGGVEQGLGRHGEGGGEEWRVGGRSGERGEVM